jgi:hypothetical protein
MTMTSKAARFSTEDWTAVTAAPLLTAMWVVAGHRRRGRAMLAVLRAYRDAQKVYDTGLLRELLAASPAGAIERPKDTAALRREAPAELRRAAAALERSATPEERSEYRRFVLALAGAAATAARHGGLSLGRSEPQSEGEPEALRSIEEILGD